MIGFEFRNGTTGSNVGAHVVVDVTAVVAAAVIVIVGGNICLPQCLMNWQW
jgi:hypothetical protein